MKNNYDLLKTFAILLVVIGHITILYCGHSFGLIENKFLQLITTIIYVFHMPLFIALSGAIYEIGVEKGKYLNLKAFFVLKFQRILVPFLIVGGCFLAPTLLSLEMSKGLNYTNTVYNIWCCLGLEKHLWYLPALFWIFIIVRCFDKFRLNSYVVFLISVLASFCNSLFFDFSIFCLSSGIHYLPYFILGIIIQKGKYNNERKIFFISSLLTITMGIIIKITSVIWIDAILALLLPCALITSILPISQIVFPLLKNNFLLKLILNNSFAIYLFHVMIIFMLYSFFSRDIPTLIMIPFVFVFSIVCSILFAMFLRKMNFQIIIGEK